MAEKRPKLPLILTANELLDGNVVYFDGEGWSAELGDALVASDDAAAERLERQLATDNGIVEPFLATVTLDADGQPAVTHYRERIRISGPTFERTHGPSAAAGAA
jgi:hypothetical protein